MSWMVASHRFMTMHPIRRGFLRSISKSSSRLPLPAVRASSSLTSDVSPPGLEGDEPHQAELSLASPDPSSSAPTQSTGSSNLSKQARINALIRRMQSAAQRTIEHRQQLAADRDRLSAMGSVQTTLNTSRPSHLRTHPSEITDLTLATLISATAHLGHNKSLTCPTNYPLIYGTRSDLAIIDLRQTLSYLRRACSVVRETVAADGIVLFANGPRGTEQAIAQASARLGPNGYSLGLRSGGRGAGWVRGTLTNAPEVLKRPRQVAKQLRLAADAQQRSDGPGRRQQADNLETLKFQPALIIVFSPRDNRVLLREAALKQIPTIGVIDTDVDPRVVTYPIPANDDGIRSIELIAGVLSRAGQDGLRKRTQQLASRFAGAESRAIASEADV